MGLEFSSSKKSKRCHICAKITSPVKANDLPLHGGWKKRTTYSPNVGENTIEESKNHLKKKQTQVHIIETDTVWN